jgi:hypothetical protein
MNTPIKDIQECIQKSIIEENSTTPLGNPTKLDFGFVVEIALYGELLHDINFSQIEVLVNPIYIENLSHMEFRRLITNIGKEVKDTKNSINILKLRQMEVIRCIKPVPFD